MYTAHIGKSVGRLGRTEVAWQGRRRVCATDEVTIFTGRPCNTNIGILLELAEDDLCVSLQGIEAVSKIAEPRHNVATHAISEIPGAL
jgi:hypothetical protein